MGHLNFLSYYRELKISKFIFLVSVQTFCLSVKKKFKPNAKRYWFGFHCVSRKINVPVWNFQQHFRVAAAVGEKKRLLLSEIKANCSPRTCHSDVTCAKYMSNYWREVYETKKKFTNEKKKHYLWIKQDKFEQKAISKL